MATMPIYGKILFKNSSLEYKGRWPCNLVCSIAYSSTTKFVQMMSQGWPWPILRQDQIWSCMLFYREKLKQWLLQKLMIVVYDIKVGKCSQLKWLHEALWVPKVKVIYWLRWPWSNSIRFNIFKLLFLNNRWLSRPQHSGERYRTNGPLVHAYKYMKDKK